MTRLAALAVFWILGHLLAPYAAVIIAAEVTAFAVACAVLVWLLVTSRHTWRPVWRARPAAAGKAGAR